MTQSIRITRESIAQREAMRKSMTFIKSIDRAVARSNMPIDSVDDSRKLEAKAAAIDAKLPRQWRPIPLEALPRKLRRFVNEASQTIGIDAANVAASVLSIISGTIGRTFVLQIKSGYQEYAMLWVVLIADSGFAKSPALKFARRPLDLLQNAAWKRYKTKEELWRFANAQNSRNPTTPPPVLERYFVSNTSTAALMVVLSENPHGVCLIRDEIGAFFGGMTAFKSAQMDMQNYIELHGGHPVYVDRKTKNPILTAATPSLSIIGGIQSDVIRRTVAREPEFITTGFGARFLMVFSPRKAVRWNCHEVDGAVLQSYDELIKRLLDYRNTITPKEPAIVALTKEAESLIITFQNDRADESEEVSDGGMCTFLNKAGIHAARLCLNLHVVECAEQDIDPASVPVSSDTMQRALILSEWFLNEAHRIYGMFAGQVVDKESEIILTKIREREGKATSQQLVHCTKKYQRQGGTGELEQKLWEMVRAKLLAVRNETAGNGRTVTYFCIPVPSQG